MKIYNKFYYNNLKLINNILKMCFVINFIILFLTDNLNIMFFSLLFGIISVLAMLFNENFKTNYEKLNSKM